MIRELPKLWGQQAAAAPLITERNEHALFMDPGTGKTATIIHGLRGWYNKEGAVRSTLILAPLVVLQNWKKEFLMHSNISENLILVLNESGPKRLRSFEKMRRERCGFICVLNYEALQTEALFKELVLWKPDALVCDESHRCKEHRSKRARYVLQIARTARRRYILTGTPIINSPMDIFMQYQILEGGRGDATSTFQTNNFYVFRAKYFEDKNAYMPRDRWFPNWQPKVTTSAQFNELIYRKASRALKKDCMDLPPMVCQTIEIGMSIEQEKLYKEMKRDFITFLKDSNKVVLAQMALTKGLRLQQIASGYVKTEDGLEIELKETPREAALRDLLTDLTPGHKVIVWAIFKRNYKQIGKVCDQLGIKYALLTGDQTSKEKNESVEAFEKDPSVRVMIANQGAGGIGINLVSASYSIFFSRDFSLEKDIQAEARNYRGGSEIHEKVTRIDLVIPNTIDELVLKALKEKQKISDLILNSEQYI